MCCTAEYRHQRYFCDQSSEHERRKLDTLSAHLGQILSNHREFHYVLRSFVFLIEIWLHNVFNCFMWLRSCFYIDNKELYLLLILCFYTFNIIINYALLDWYANIKCKAKLQQSYCVNILQDRINHKRIQA